MKKILVLLFLLISFNANAWLWIEPYAGYDIAINTEVTGADTSGITDLGYNGFVYGGRIGFAWKILLLGVDLNGMTGSSDIEISGTEYNQDVTKSNFGVFVGLNFDLTLIGFRAWVTYFFTNNLGFHNSDLSLTEAKGNGFGLGAGITFFKFLGLNFEYHFTSYDEFVYSDGTTDNDLEYKPSEIIISLSVPLNLF